MSEVGKRVIGPEESGTGPPGSAGRAYLCVWLSPRHGSFRVRGLLRERAGWGRG